MKKLLLLFAAVTICLMSYGQDFSRIDPVLQEEMQLRSSAELIRVNIIMKDQYDQLSLRSKADLYQKKEAKRAFVVNELKNHAKQTQQEVMRYLDNFAENKSVTDITQFWIYNGITCFATIETIEALSYLDDILIIGFDKEHLCIPESGESKPEEGGSKELTYNVTKVNAHLVWDLGYTGEGIIVGVIDTGVNYNHNDLKTHLWEHPDYPNHGWNFVNNGNNPMDDHSHGTHCAGTVAGDGTGESQTGMAPNAKIMCLKVWNSQGSGSTSQMCAGFQFGVEHGAHVLSMSGGVSGGGSATERIQFRNTMINVLEAGVVASIAAGNEHSGSYSQPIPNQVRVPGNCPPPWLHPDQMQNSGGISAVVCVGATDSNDAIADFSGAWGWGSSWGPVTWQSITGFNDYPYNPGIGLMRPDVCAPGVDIKSCAHNNNYGYTEKSGTSMACPGVSGVMALMLSKNPELTPAQICEILETTAVKLPTPTSPKGNTYGSGRVNALDAVNAVVVGPISIQEVLVDDSEGNNNGNPNPGETVKVILTLINDSDLSVNGVSVTISSSNEFVTIINDFADFGNFAAGEIKTVESAFTFELSSFAPAKNKLTFNAIIATADDQFPGNFSFFAFDYKLDLTNTYVVTGGGGNVLVPGETADIFTAITNNGNEPALELSGFLSSNSNDISINNNTAVFGDMNPDQNYAAPFNVSLGTGATQGSINIPFNLLVTDQDGRHSTFNFTYKDYCELVFNLFDSYGDGWNNAKLVVSFSNGNPNQTLTVNNGSSATYTIPIDAGVTVSLSWIAGSYDSECSFVISYQGGGQIYSTTGYPGSGTFFSWITNCSVNVNCNPISNLEIAFSNNNAELSWETPAAGTPNYYEIYKNYISVGTTSNTYFSAPITGLEDIFCVYAVFNDCLIPQCVSANAFIECPQPTDIGFTIDSDIKVNVTWNSPVEDANVVGYKIYINDSYIETTTDETYTFSGEVNTEYTFCVSALNNIGETECESEKICCIINIIERPVNLTATALSSAEIKLEWEYESILASFIVFRDNINIAKNIVGTEYVDNTDILFGIEYCYVVKAVIVNAISAPSNEACAIIVGIEEYFSNNVKVYPNPANSIINIEGQGIETITVFNSNGQMVKNVKANSDITQLNVSNFVAGNYVLTVSYANGSSENIKILIQ